MQRRDFLPILPMAALGTLATGDESNPAKLIPCGQIGTAHAHAAGKLETLRRLSPPFEVRGVVEPDESRRNRASNQNHFKGIPWREEAALLGDKEIAFVTVETTLDASTETALRAVRAGKHVHLDKPGGADHAAFAAMRREAESQGRIVQMGYMLRHNPAFAWLFHAAKKGAFGDIMEIHATMGKLADPSLRNQIAKHPGHGMFELACHLVDAVLTIMGPPENVTAFSAMTRAPEDTLPDNQLAVLSYPKALVTLRCNHADPGGMARRAFSLIGTQGSATIFPLESGRLQLDLSTNFEAYDKGKHEIELPLPQGRYDGEFLLLASCIRGDTTFPWSAAHDIAVHATAMKAAGLDP